MDISNISRQMVGFLLQKPKNWTSEHVRALNVKEKGTISAAEMVGQEHLPDEGDQAAMSASSKLMTAIQFLKGSTEENKIKGEVPYGLFLIFAAFNKDPHQREYASFLTNMRRTSLTCVQITKLVASGSYLQALSQGQHLEEHLEMYRSHEFDLVEPEGRKAFLVMFMGVINCVMSRPE
ncbi:uncharacterized protein NFIA_094720 [Aspergillus fischeri NRRL 181]|uniref:Uncharacterized protein n=1 Tax=Neosartorya fischeri (strain ATCC 1020 / DSM 3700 / CBS 544.65 / FGSC A1164 / JCM 1740 / NRRL 181 / WB 181) TaxID=331117 RepID=A1DAG2_NEOFI|nr:uncharacterized protein NFIA_094720 [Aspergillus fischeri NRRL 181]EAW19852.1 hypothetical protein NFIA_094720 [Aspergillus fischeri NRRL 181]